MNVTKHYAQNDNGYGKVRWLGNVRRVGRGKFALDNLTLFCDTPAAIPSAIRAWQHAVAN